MANTLKMLAGEACSALMERIPFGIGTCFQLVREKMRIKQIDELHNALEIF